MPAGLLTGDVAGPRIGSRVGWAVDLLETMWALKEGVGGSFFTESDFDGLAIPLPELDILVVNVTGHRSRLKTLMIDEENNKDRERRGIPLHWLKCGLPTAGVFQLAIYPLGG